MASQEAEAFKDRLRAIAAANAGGDSSLEGVRARGEAFGQLTAPAPGVTWSRVDAGGVPAIWATPADGGGEHVVEYLHGGGYMIGSAEGYRNFTGRLATAAGCRVLSVDYGLAPEHPHPGPVNDSVTAYRWLLEQGHRPGQLALAGDSAGGGLALATLLKLRDEGLPQPAAAVPLSPWADMELTGESGQTNAERDVLISPAGLKFIVDLFLAGADPRDPLVSPIHGDYRGIAPLYLQVGGDETLLDDARRVAERAGADGVEVGIDVFPEMQHVFQLGAGHVPESDEAVSAIAAFLAAHWGRL